MSFNLEQGLPVAIIVGGTADGTYIFLDKDNEDGKKSFSIKNGKFAPMPNTFHRIHYKVGPSGVGKSTSCAQYCEEYQTFFPENPIYILSMLDEDPAFDKIKNLKRLVIDESYIKTPIQASTFGKDVLVIFDDIDTISNPKILKSIYNTMSQCLEIGRHNNIQMLITSHLINGRDRNISRTIQNEVDSLTIFPQGANMYQVTMNLQNYWGLTPKQIRKIMGLKSRWVILYKKHPQLCLTENRICFLSELTNL